MTRFSRRARRLRPSALAAALFIALPPAASAEPAEPARNTHEAAGTAPALETVTVTAQRRAENIQDVPMAITAVEADKLEILASGGGDIRFLAGRLPSLNIESSFGRAFPRFYIRGLGNTDFDLNASQPVSLVHDGVVQENPILKGFPLFDIDQVEMARGPQGTLFGRNSPAGVIKFESARPEREFGGYGSLSYGRYGTANLSGAVTGGVGDNGALRLSVLHQRREDWVDNTRNGSGDDLEGYRESAARLQYRYAPDDGFEALANLHARKLDGTARLFRANIIRPGSNDLLGGFRRDRVSIDGRNEQNLDQIGANLRLRRNLGSTTLHSITGYESVDAYSRGDIDGGYGAVFLGEGSYGPGLIPFPAESADGLPHHRQLSQELRIESDEWGRLDWQAGVFGFDESITAETFSYDTLAPGRPPNGYATQKQDNQAWAVFASADYDLSDRLKLRGGLRYSDDRKVFVAERVTGPFGPPIAPIRVKPSDTDVCGDFSAVYQAGDQVNLYGRVARGFRAPSVQGRLMFADATLPSDELVTVAQSETVLSWEAGLKAQLWDDRLRLGLAFYRYTIDDPQLTAVGGNANIARLLNADKAAGHGAELDLGSAAQRTLPGHLRRELESDRDPRPEPRRRAMRRAVYPARSAGQRCRHRTHRRQSAAAGAAQRVQPDRALRSAGRRRRVLRPYRLGLSQRSRFLPLRVGGVHWQAAARRRPAPRLRLALRRLRTRPVRPQHHRSQGHRRRPGFQQSDRLPQRAAHLGRGVQGTFLTAALFRIGNLRKTVVPTVFRAGESGAGPGWSAPIKRASARPRAARQRAAGTSAFFEAPCRRGRPRAAAGPASGAAQACMKPRSAVGKLIRFGKIAARSLLPVTPIQRARVAAIWSTLVAGIVWPREKLIALLRVWSGKVP